LLRLFSICSPAPVSANTDKLFKQNCPSRFSRREIGGISLLEKIPQQKIDFFVGTIHGVVYAAIKDKTFVKFSK
jgi:hypothetical protein